MFKIKVSVILPTYNEAGNIINLIKTISRELSKKGINYEIIIIDDNSSDKTGLLVEKFSSQIPYIRVIIRKKEKGLASAIRKGLDVAVGKILVVMDTDFNHEPEVVPKLIKKCNTYDIAIGSRFIKGGGMENKVREKLSYLFNLLIRVLLASPVHDNLSGFFAIRRAQLEKLNFDKIFQGYGEYFINFVYFAKKQRARFIEIPSFYKNREYGVSKSQFEKMFKDYLHTTIKLMFNK